VDEFLRENIPVPVRRLRIPPKNWYLHVKKPWTTAEKKYIRVPAAYLQISLASSVETAETAEGA
jgi:hypothetical protein